MILEWNRDYIESESTKIKFAKSVSFTHTNAISHQNLFASFGDKRSWGMTKETTPLLRFNVLHYVCSRLPQKLLLNFSQIKINITVLLFKVKNKFLLEGSQKTFTVCDMQYS